MMVTVAILFKSVRHLIQWFLRFLRDPQTLSTTLALLGMLQPQVFGSLKMHRDLGLGLYLLCIGTIAWICKI